MLGDHTKIIKFLQSHGAKGEEVSTLETTQGQIDGFFSQLPYKCHLKEVASVGD